MSEFNEGLLIKPLLHPFIKQKSVHLHYFLELNMQLASPNTSDIDVKYYMPPAKHTKPPVHQLHSNIQFYKLTVPYIIIKLFFTHAHTHYILILVSEKSTVLYVSTTWHLYSSLIWFIYLRTYHNSFFVR